MTVEEALEAAARLCESRDPNVLLEEREAMPQNAYWTMLDVLKRLATRIRALKAHEDPPPRDSQEIPVVCLPGVHLRVQWIHKDGRIEHERLYRRPETCGD